LKLLAQITLALSVVSIIIGIHQSFFYGILNSYWLFTGALFFLLLYRLIRKFYISEEPQQGSLKEENKLIQKSLKKNKNKIK
jgi:Na+/melibiose symporter-like transporter